MTQREEISIRLGVDSKAAVTSLERFQGSVSRISKDIGKSFTKGLGRIADSFGLMSVISQLRDVGAEFKRLKEARDLEAIQERFGNLAGSEMDALENIGGNLEKFWEKAKITTLGGVQSILSVLAEMVHGRKGLSAAIDSVVEDDVARIMEFQKALEESKAAKLWESEKNALLQFKAIREQLEFKRANTDTRAKMLEEKIKELESLMYAAKTPEEKYDYAGKILLAEDALKDVRAKQDDERLEKSRKDLEGMTPSPAEDPNALSRWKGNVDGKLGNWSKKMNDSLSTWRDQGAWPPPPQQPQQPIRIEGPVEVIIKDVNL